MSKKITLKSSDGESFEVEEAVALKSQTISHIIEDGCADNVIPLANVKANILGKVLEYCKKHVDDDDESATDETKEALKNSDADFMKLDLHIVFEIIQAANYLNIKSLLELSCQTVADEIKDKTPEQIREIFNIENDFTPEEEEALRKENQWAFE